MKKEMDVILGLSVFFHILSLAWLVASAPGSFPSVIYHNIVYNGKNSQQ